MVIADWVAQQPTNKTAAATTRTATTTRTTEPLGHLANRRLPQHHHTTPSSSPPTDAVSPMNDLSSSIMNGCVDVVFDKGTADALMLFNEVLVMLGACDAWCL
jgi:hypothetical protein